MAGPVAKVGVELNVMGKKALAQVKALGSKMSKVTGKIPALPGMLGGIGGVYVMSRMTKEVVKMDGALTRLSIQAHISGAEEKKLRQTILDTSVATGKGRASLQDYLQGVTDMTGDLNIARDAMTDVAKASVITGADMGGLGLIVSDLAVKFNLTGEEAGKMLAVLIEQGEKGRFTLNEMGRTGAMVMATAGLAGMGAKGAEGVREMGAMMQLMRMGFSSAEEAATGFNTAVVRLSDPANLRKAQSLLKGLKVETDEGKLRDFGDLFLDIIDKSGGDMRKLAPIFGARGIKSIATFREELLRNEGSIDAVRDKLNEFANVSGDAADFQRKYSRAISGTEGKFSKFKTRMESLFTEVVATEANLEALGTAAEIAAKGITKAVRSIQEASEGLAQFMIDQGIIDDVTAYQSAENTQTLTKAQFQARQAVGSIQVAKESGGKQKIDEDFLAWYMETQGGGRTKEQVAKALRAGSGSKEGAEALMGQYSKHLLEQGGPAMGRTQGQQAIIDTRINAVNAPMQAVVEQQVQSKTAELTELLQAIEGSFAKAAKEGIKEGLRTGKITVFIPQKLDVPEGTNANAPHGGD